MPVQVEPLLRHIHRLVSHPDAFPGTDGELLGRFLQHQDECAFAALVARHAPMVLGVCRRVLRDRHQAEDAVQAVFLLLARKAAAVRPVDRLAAWLYGVARRVAGNALRGEARRRRREEVAGQAMRSPASRDSFDELTARELLAALDAEVQRLPETYRLPVLLCCLEGKTQEEAARQLGWTAGSVKGRLERGRARLHARLVRRGLSLSAALGALEVARGSVQACMAPTFAATAGRAALASLGTGGIAPEVAALAEGAMKGTLMAKAKLGLVLLLSAGVLAAGTGLVLHRVLAGKQPEVPSRADKGPEKAKEEKPPPHQFADRHGDPLPAGAIRRLGTTRLRRGLTHDLVFTPDGKILTSAGIGRGICLWDTRTGREIRHLGGAEFGPLALSPNGRFLASSIKEGKIHLWDLKAERPPREMDAESLCSALAFSPDGTLLASGGIDNLIRLIDVASGRVVHRLRGHKDNVWTFAFSPDGKTLASAGGMGDCDIPLWDPVTGRERARLRGHTKANVHAVAFFPDGKTLASADDHSTIRLWDVARGTAVRVIEAPRVTGALAVSPDGRLLASGHHNDGLIRLWDPTTGRELRHWKASFFAVDALAFAPDGKTLASGSARLDSSVRLWDPATGQERLPFGGPQTLVAWLHFTADGKAVQVRCYDGSERRWDWAADREQVLETGEPFHSRPCFSVDGRVRARDSRDGTITVWDDPRKAAGRALGKHRGQIFDGGFALALSADGKLLASGGRGGEIHLWDVRAGKELWEIQANAEIVSLAFSRDGKVLASGAAPSASAPPPKSTLRLWEVATGKAIGAPPRAEPMGDMLFSPDGRYLATRDNSPGPRLWDLTRNEELARPPAQGRCAAFAFSPDSRLLAWSAWNWNAGDGRIHVVEVASQQEVLTLPGHPSGTSPLAFAPDGRLLASAGADSTVLVWDLTGRCRDGRFAPLKAFSADLEKLWDALGDANAAKAFQACQTLALAPAEQVVPLLRKRLQQPAADAKNIAARIEDLDSREFEVREKAMRELERLGAVAEPALRRALAAKPSPEARRRIQALLDEWKPSAGEPLRRRRAIAVLEQLGTPAAREVLEHLSRTDPRTFLNEEAKRALERLAERPAAAPD